MLELFSKKGTKIDIEYTIYARKENTMFLILIKPQSVKILHLMIIILLHSICYLSFVKTVMAGLKVDRTTLQPFTVKLEKGGQES